METNRLRYFQVLAKTGNVRSASEILNITPSTLSKAIHQLQDEIGIDLFVPSGRGIAITDQGKLFAERSAEITMGLNRLVDEFKGAQIRSNTPLKIATFEVFSTYFLSAFEDETSLNQNLVLQECGPGEIESAVVDQRVDFGITYAPVAYSGCEHVKICKIEMDIFGRKDVFKDTAFAELPFVIPSFPLKGAPTKVSGLDGWPHGAFERFVKYKVSLMESALELCRQGKCVGYFPKFVIRLHNEKYRKTFHLEPLLHAKNTRFPLCDVFMVRKSNSIESKEEKKVARLLRTKTKALG